MLYGFNLDRLHEADIAYAKALVEMVNAGNRHQELATELGQKAETAARLVETAKDIAKTTVQGPADRSRPVVVYPFPHQPRP
jgi:hypothetical protein